MTYRANSEITSTNLLGHYAGFISRLVAFFIDVAVISLTIIAAGWFVSITMDVMQIRPMVALLVKNVPWAKKVVILFLSPLTASLAGFAFVVIYYVFFWFFAGQTIGKAVMGLRVVPLRGGKMTLWRAILRYIGYFLSTLSLGIGFLWIIIDDRRMAWHDKLARTCVVYTWEAHPDETFLANAIGTISSREQAIKSLSKRQNQLAHLMKQQVDLNNENKQSTQNE